MEILRGQIIVCVNLDEVIRIIREGNDPKVEMIARWELSEVQAEAILNMRLRALSRLEEIEIRKEPDGLTAEEGRLTRFLASEKRQWRAVAKEVAETGGETALDGLSRRLGENRSRTEPNLGPWLRGSARAPLPAARFRAASRVRTGSADPSVICE
jgi:DNA gyrase/topoisomerase IV subunit A